ncbi:MAG TPA: hypothetical protein EYQ47_01675 [Cycloclasticus sp.]|nr:hypothetical protein [Cycloclasticus sp.]
MSNANTTPRFQIGDEVLTVVPDLPHLNFQSTRILDVIAKDDGFYYMTVLQQKDSFWKESKFLKLSANDSTLVEAA